MSSTPEHIPGAPEGGDNAPLLNHDADGIREYDNPLPSWWTLIFIVTIAFSVVYWIWYHGGGGGTTMHEDWAADVAEAKTAQAANAANSEPTDAEIDTLSKDAGAMAAAKALFEGKCAACHRPDGGGLIGPNLTDKNWIHGKGGGLDIFKVVRDGVPAKGMIAWGAMLSPTEMRSVSAYIRTLQGSNPANPKAPEGEAAP